MKSFLKSFLSFFKLWALLEQGIRGAGMIHCCLLGHLPTSRGSFSIGRSCCLFKMESANEKKEKLAVQKLNSLTCKQQWWPRLVIFSLPSPASNGGKMVVQIGCFEQWRQYNSHGKKSSLRRAIQNGPTMEDSCYVLLVAVVSQPANWIVPLTSLPRMPQELLHPTLVWPKVPFPRSFVLLYKGERGIVNK